VLPQVAREAYRMAGVQDPGRELDVVEVHDASSAQTLLWREGLGLAEAGGPALNPSGGAMSAQPGFATGLVRVAEVFERLARGEGKTGLAHGMTGFVGQAHCAWILRKRSRA
jgi:acetyl-CoA C-acetyltransferase